MNSLIVVHSYHYNNTRKVAEAMAQALKAQVMTLAEIDTMELREYDLVGFGAGIDSGRHYKELLDFASALPSTDGRMCFIFSTSAIISDSKVTKDHAALRGILIAKGYQIKGEFSCLGFNTNSFLKYLGGMNKGRPNAENIENARKFAMNLAKQ